MEPTHIQSMTAAAHMTLSKIVIRLKIISEFTGMSSFWNLTVDRKVFRGSTL